MSFFKTRPHTLESSDYNLVKYRVKNEENIDSIFHPKWC